MAEEEKSQGSRSDNRDYHVAIVDDGGDDVKLPPASVLPEFKDQVRPEPESGFVSGRTTDDGAMALVVEELPDFKDQVRPQRVPDVRQLQRAKQQQPDRQQVPESHDSFWADAEAELLVLDDHSSSVNDSTVQEPQHTSDIVYASTAKVVDNEAERITIQPKRKTIFLIVMLLILLISGAVVGGVCGMGSCRGRHIKSAEDSNPETATCAPSTNLIVNFINNVSLAMPCINYPASASATAEEKALQWVIEEDLVTYTMSHASSRQQLVQRYALATVWFNTDGVNWNKTAGWLASEMECTWYGVNCDTSDQLIGLDLSSNGLAGLLSPDLCLLEKISDLQLSNNGLSGPMPSSIGNCRNLKYLNLDVNEFSGTIPESMSQLSNLVNVTLHRNKFTGPIGSWWGSSTSMESLYLGNNNLIGTIPSSLGNFSLMTSFSVSYNELSGSLPASLSQWSNIREFWCEFNFFNGTIPSVYGETWKNLQEAYFYFNSFSGSVPEGFCNGNNTILRADCISEVSCLCCQTCL